MNNQFDNDPALPDSREREAGQWAASVLGLQSVSLEPVSGDASFRRYFRFSANGTSVILMDAPPDKEGSESFIDIARRLREANLLAPEILAFDLQLGFGLLQDFGDTLYRELINQTTVESQFRDLFDVLNGMAREVSTTGLPVYDEAALAQELDLFKSWYLEQHKGRTMTGPELAIWENLCKLLIDRAREQPQVFVHKDFHSCNLLHTENGPGIIDFQDGLLGPISYDFISLVWDRYIAWPREQIDEWMAQVHSMLPLECNLQEWIRYCDWMGLQRNLKIVGIFARLRHRDGKQGYVEMIPRFYQYLLDVLPRYPEFSDFNRMLEQQKCAP
jgi:aminoglycoside/choline kinase family phosphotransferase